MTRKEFETAFSELGENYKTKDIDRFSKRLIRENADVSFLKPLVLQQQQYHRIYFQVSMGLLERVDEKLKFLEENFELLQDWWHVDQIPVFLANSLDFDTAYRKAQEYVRSELPFVRRLGYVLFIPRLVKTEAQVDRLIPMLKNDTEYYVVMAQAWLISYFAMCAPDRTYAFLKDCDLDYTIVGKAIQKICDSYVVSKEDKERFKALREVRKQRKPD